MNAAARLRIIGALDWRPFDEEDWMAMAGAGEDAHTAHADGLLYVRSSERGVTTVEWFDEKLNLIGKLEMVEEEAR